MATMTPHPSWRAAARSRPADHSDKVLMQTRALLLRLAPLPLTLLAACNSGSDGGAAGGRPSGGPSGGSETAVPSPAPAPAPTISAPARLSIDEGSSKALDFSVSVSADADLQLSLAGPDATRFRLQGQSVFFVDSPDFENPPDGSNRLVVEIVATTAEASTSASVTIDIMDVPEARVIDGPVADAIVFVDLDADGVLDLDEPSTLSDDDGYVVVPAFTAREGITPRLVATDGIDTFTGLRLDGFSMSAVIRPDSTTTFMVTPLSSLLASLADEGLDDTLLTVLGVEGGVAAIRTQDIWQQTLAGDEGAARLLQLVQQLSITLQTLRHALPMEDADPRTMAALMRALERRLAEQLMSGLTLSDSSTISVALAAALLDTATAPLSEARISEVAAAVAEVNALLASAEAEPTSPTSAAVLAVAQGSTPERLRALALGNLSLQGFSVEQRLAFSSAVLSIRPDAPDLDGDGMLDSFDSDDDGDGINDDQDANPRDRTVSAPASFTTAQRFKLLSMASFGATPELMADLEHLGPEAWVDAQLSMPSAYDSTSDDWPTHLERTIEISQAFAPDIDFFELDPTDGSIAFNERTSAPLIRRQQMAAWNDNVFGSVDHPLVGSDVLRQRMAYALSQLLVTSASTPPLDQRGESLAYYYDLLARHAFGNYRDLLGDVARSPTMGTFLSHAANRKASAAQATRPDENFARELVQLFTLGLYQLTDGGDALIDDNGSPAPVYTQSDIEELAKVMTGWNLAGSRDFRGLRTGDGDHTRPMVFDPAWHEDERDPYYDGSGDGQVTVLGQRIALDAPDRTPDGNGNSTHSGLDASLDVLFAHGNIAPFVARHLIRHFVTANPSPRYVARVAAVFNDDGSGVKGNLGAVLKAILLDQDAYGAGTINSKIKEPLLAYTQLLRALDVAPVPSGFMSNKVGLPITAVNVYYESDLAGVIGYAPMRAESVFNFFDPDFVPADADLARNELLAPEMVMMTDQYFANIANLVLWLSNTREFVRFDRGFSTRRVLGFSNVRVFDVNFTAALNAMELAMEGDSNMDFASINLTDESGDQPYKAAAVDALVDWVDLHLFGTTLPAEYRQALTQHLRDGMHKGEGRNDTPEVKTNKRVLEAWELVRDALVMATAMPAYMVQ